MIETPYLLFLGDAPDGLAAKVAQGIRDWRPDNVIGQLRLPNCGADVKVPELSLEEARKAGAKTLVIGVANRGGVISEAGLERLRTLMPEARERIIDGLKPQMILSLFTTQTFVAMVEGKRAAEST